MLKIKTLSFAVVHFSVAFAVVYLLTGDWLIGSAVALIEPAVNTVAYYCHELGWRRLERRLSWLEPAAVLTGEARQV